MDNALADLRAAMPASMISWGVSKSGSPAARPMTSFPYRKESADAFSNGAFTSFGSLAFMLGRLNF